MEQSLLEKEAALRVTEENSSQAEAQVHDLQVKLDSSQALLTQLVRLTDYYVDINVSKGSIVHVIYVHRSVLD